ncbi:MAG TPA: cation:proton antiporter [bacterium]|nr:cation:proton antiporter [bacterium]
MSPGVVLLLAALAVLVLVGARTGFGKGSLPAVLSPLVDTGTVFILIGALLGPSGFNLFTAGMLSQLSPVLVIGLGWIGFLYGSHFELRLLRRYPPALYAAAATEALIAFALVAALAWALLTYALAPELPGRERLAAALLLGICASGTAPAGIFQLGGRSRLSADDLSALRFLSTVDDIPAMLLLGLMGALLHPTVPGALSVQPALWLLFSVGIGVGLGLITHWLFPRVDDVRHNSLVLLGVVSLGAGAAVMLRLSPLFVTALAGLTFANLSPRKERAYGLLAESEHTLYTVFLLVAGLLLRFDWKPLWILVPAYLLLRAGGKLGGGYAARRLLMRGSGVSPLIGAGMLFQGGMALAMAISFQRTHLAELDAQVTATIVLGVVVFELLGPSVADAVLGGRRRR